MRRQIRSRFVGADTATVHVSATMHLNKPRVCTVHCRMLLASVVLADQPMALLALLDEAAAERRH